MLNRVNPRELWSSRPDRRQRSARCVLSVTEIPIQGIDAIKPERQAGSLQCPEATESLVQWRILEVAKGAVGSPAMDSNMGAQWSGLCLERAGRRRLATGVGHWRWSTSGAMRHRPLTLRRSGRPTFDLRISQFPQANLDASPNKGLSPRLHAAKMIPSAPYR
jgi:hypothetical protein